MPAFGMGTLSRLACVSTWYVAWWHGAGVGCWRWRGALDGTVVVRVFVQCSHRVRLLPLWCVQLLLLLCLCLGLRLGLRLGVCMCLLGSYVGLLRLHVQLCKSFLLGRCLLAMRERVSGSAIVPAAAHADLSKRVCWLCVSADITATAAT